MTRIILTVIIKDEVDESTAAGQERVEKVAQILDSVAQMLSPVQSSDYIIFLK